MSRENSALIALNELKNLEAQRVQTVVEDARSKEEAERQRVETAERQRRDEAERVRREEEERARLEQEERDAREREERIRLAEAETRARAEQEGRLREEQMRLDAQVKMAERKKTPYWLYATAGVLAIGLVIGGYIAYQRAEQKKQDDAEQAALNAANEQEIAAQKKQIEELAAEKAKLEKEQEELDKAQADLETKLAAATSDADKAKLLEEKRLLDEQQSGLTKKISANKKKGGSTSSSSDTKPAVKDRKDKLELVGGDAPLD